MLVRRTPLLLPMHFHIITLFPQAFASYLNESILKRARERGIIDFSFYNPRDCTDDRWRRIDRRPYGGGPGMVLEALPLLRAAENALARARGNNATRRGIKVIFFSPSGRQFDTAYAKNVARRSRHVVMICGRYEGVDARVQKILRAEALSIGPYVTTGGELPAMVVADVVARQVKGVLGTHASLEEERPSGSEVYTRPEVLEWKGRRYRVPKVLLSGHHAQIDAWRTSTRRQNDGAKKKGA